MATRVSVPSVRPAGRDGGDISKKGCILYIHSCHAILERFPCGRERARAKRRGGRVRSDGASTPPRTPSSHVTFPHCQSAHRLTTANPARPRSGRCARLSGRPRDVECVAVRVQRAGRLLTSKDTPILFVFLDLDLAPIT